MIDDGGSTASSPTTAPQAAVRSDGGPNESAVAASIAPRPNQFPDEAAAAANVGAVPSSIVPRENQSAYEAARAALVAQGAGPYRPASPGPDESAVAASIAGR
jgi:hypothetical protein